MTEPTPPSPVKKPGGAPSAGRLITLLVMLAGLATSEYWMAHAKRDAVISYSDFYRDVADKKVGSVDFDRRDLRGQFSTAQTIAGKSVTAFETSLPELEDPTLLPLLREKDVEVSARTDHQSGVLPVLLSLLPWVVILGAWMWMSRRVQSMMSSGGPLAGMTRGKAKRFDRESEVRIHFDDVAGLAPAKRDLGEIVDYLRTPDRFLKLGGHIPRGVLLVGPPGTGKTRSTPSDGPGVRGSAAATTSGSRRSISCCPRWTASPATIWSSSWPRPIAPTCSIRPC